jgi:hypothetical protein
MTAVVGNPAAPTTATQTCKILIYKREGYFAFS